MLLYCIRHAESAFNAEGRIQGQTDVPLSDFGRRQSEAAADFLAAMPVEAVYSSPLGRAYQTADPIARRLTLPIQTDPRLMEINAGIFQGLLRTEINKQYPAEIARWASGDPEFQIPGGESRLQLAERGLAVFREIAQSGARQAVVVSHGGLIAAALKALLEIPPARHPFVLENCSINRVEIHGDVVRLISVNQVDHLRGIGLAGQGDL
ncbi:MAG: histidine phosphatase family protein [Planctomycetota bacterium]